MGNIRILFIIVYLGYPSLFSGQNTSLDDILRKLEYEMDETEQLLRSISTQLDMVQDNMYYLKDLYLRLQDQENAALGCPVNYMYCGNGEHKFVAKTFMCDGYKDCRNGEDETNFVCDMPFVVPSIWKADILYDTCDQPSYADEAYLMIVAIKTPPWYRTHVKTTVLWEGRTYSSIDDEDYAVPVVATYDPLTRTVTLGRDFDQNDYELACTFKGYRIDMCIAETYFNKVKCSVGIYRRVW